MLMKYIFVNEMFLSLFSFLSVWILQSTRQKKKRKKKTQQLFVTFMQTVFGTLMKIMTRIIIWINAAYKYSNFTKFNKWIYLLKLQKKGVNTFKKRKERKLSQQGLYSGEEKKGGKRKTSIVTCRYKRHHVRKRKESGVLFKKYLLEYYKRSSVSPALSCVKMKEWWAAYWETDPDTIIFNFKRGFLFLILVWMENR